MNDGNNKNIKDALRESEETARALLNAPPDAAFLVDMEGTLITVNENLARRFGKKADEMTGRNIFDYIAGELIGSRKAHLHEVFRTGRPCSFVDFRDGLCLENHYYPLFDGGDKVARIAVYSRDITESRRAQEALKESEERYRSAIENSNDGVAIMRGGIHLHVNKKFVEIFGYDEPGDIIGKPQSMVVHSDDYERVKDLTDRRQKGENVPDRYEFKGIRKNGETIFLEVSATAITYRYQPVALVYMRDVTARRKTEEDLWLTHFSIDHCSESIFWIKPDGRFIYVNEAACARLGYSRDELLALSIMNVDPKYTKRQFSALGRIMKKKGSTKFRSDHKTKDGAVFPVEIIANYIRYNDEELIFCFARDISEKELAEERLSTERHRFQVLIENAPFGMAMFDSGGKYLYCNPKFTEIFGYDLSDIPDREAWFDRAYPDEAVRRTAWSSWQYDAAVKEAGEKMPRTFPIVCKNGEMRFINIITVRLENGDYVVSYEDITRRRHAEEALADEKERLAVTLRSIGDGVIATDRSGRVVLINSVAEELTGWKQEEAEGKDLNEVFHIINEKTRERCENPVVKVLRMGTVVGLANHTVLVSRGGRELVIADSGAPIRGKDKNIVGVVLVFRDVTEKKKMDEELQKMSKLESVGILAGGIAHDFNNILAAILGNISLARLHVKVQDEKVYKRLLDAEQAILRAKDLTQQLLTFSKGGSPIKKTTSIENILKETAGFALTGSRVKCEFSIGKDLYSVDIDEGQISQVLNNLFINAQQAMPGGGVITVGADNIVAKQGIIEHGVFLQPGGYVRISVQDHGVGIHSNHVDKVFDPYFTTKQKGSGLGLATSYSIIKNHGGHITLESRLGAGTTFFIYLKAAKHGRKHVKNSKEDLMLTKMKGRVLLMDDEEMILRSSSEMLRSLGYEVECVTEGNEAIESYIKARNAGTPFDVIILDLTIPGGMGGKDTMKKLFTMDPDVKVIVSSGYSNDPIMARFHKYGFKGVIAKPYLMEELGEVIIHVIRGSEVI
ncbi:MAG TPA: PAS domain S-box protein [Syntrophorhabdaceae bacterium]|nr:PAS domain S-box protein [Syntrophorhabdaceae bacterium]